MTVVCGALAWFALRWAKAAAGRRRLLLRTGATALLAGPMLAILVVSTDVHHGRTICGSALSTSLQRPRPGMTLDAAQAGCRAKGERIVTAAGWYALGAGLVAAVSLAGAAVPRRRPRGA